MNSSTTYLTLTDPTKIRAEFEQLTPTAPPYGALVIGEVLEGTRLNITFTSLDQISAAISALRNLAGQWQDVVFAQRMAAAEQRRVQDFGLVGQEQAASW